MRRLSFGLVLVAVGLLAACGGEHIEPPPVPTPGARARPAIECVDMPVGKCDEVVRELTVEASGASPVSVRIACTDPPCVIARGAASIDVLYADGTRSRSGFGWAQPDPGGAPVEIPGGAPVLPVAPVCIGIALPECRSMAEGALPNGPEVVRIRSIVVRCKGVCGPDRGSGETVVTYADGRQENGTWTYETLGSG